MCKRKLIQINSDNIGDMDKNIAFYNPEEQDINKYWSDGTHIYWNYSKLKADIDSFKVLSNSFAKDKNNCFMQNNSLKNADPDTFEALNYCFAKDKNYAWCIGGRFEPTDIHIFTVCDDGINTFDLAPEKRVFNDGSTQNIVLKTSYGYAKDSKQVYYYNYWGKAKIVKKANPKTFVSFNNGHYAKNDQFVFNGTEIIKGADPKTWQLLDIKEGISKDAKKVFCRHKALSTIDVHSFQIDTVLVKNETIKLLKDNSGFYDNQGNKRTEKELIDEYFGIENE